MVFKTKIKCPICKGEATLSKTSLQMFGGLVTLKDNPIYECKKCKEKFATGKMVDATVEKARKESSFARKLISTGSSLAITVPPDLAKFYKLKKGENVQLIPAGEHLMKVEV